MTPTLRGLLFAATALAALPAFAQEITVWDWKSGDPAAARPLLTALAAWRAQRCVSLP